MGKLYKTGKKTEHINKLTPKCHEIARTCVPFSPEKGNPVAPPTFTLSLPAFSLSTKGILIRKYTMYNSLNRA